MASMPGRAIRLQRALCIPSFGSQYGMKRSNSPSWCCPSYEDLDPKSMYHNGRLGSLRFLGPLFDVLLQSREAPFQRKRDLRTNFVHNTGPAIWAASKGP